MSVCREGHRVKRAVFMICIYPVLVCSSYPNQTPGGFNNISLFLMVLEVEGPRSRHGPGGSFLRLPSHSVLTVAEREQTRSRVFLFSSEAHESYQMSTPPLSPHLILITAVETLCPKRIVLEVGASTYEFWYVLGGGSQPLSA